MKQLTVLLFACAVAAAAGCSASKTDIKSAAQKADAIVELVCGSANPVESCVDEYLEIAPLVSQRMAALATPRADAGAANALVDADSKRLDAVLDALTRKIEAGTE